MGRIWVFVLMFVVSSLYALFLESGPGRWLAEERTWLSVVIGVGYVTLLMRFLGPAPAWTDWLVAWGVSGVPVIVRSLAHEVRKEREVWEEVRR